MPDAMLDWGSVACVLSLSQLDLCARIATFGPACTEPHTLNIAATAAISGRISQSTYLVTVLVWSLLAASGVGRLSLGA